MARSIWKFLAGINLTIWLLLAIVVNLVIGSQFAKYLPGIYGPLNTLRFQEWLLSHGFGASWWVWSLFLLLFLFGLNTAACTADRLLDLLKRRREFRFAEFAVTVSPSVMHICFLVIIGGHAVTQFTADIRELPVRAGARLALPDAGITVDGFRSVFRTEPKLAGVMDGCSATITLSSHAGSVSRTINILSPVFWDGRSIHLTLAGKTMQGKQPKMVLIIKKDPGLIPILLGNGFLCILMLWYFPRIIKARNGSRS